MSHCFCERQPFFANRVVNVRNSLSEHVVTAPAVLALDVDSSCVISAEDIV